MDIISVKDDHFNKDQVYDLNLCRYKVHNTFLMILKVRQMVEHFKFFLSEFIRSLLSPFCRTYHNEYSGNPLSLEIDLGFSSLKILFLEP